MKILAPVFCLLLLFPAAPGMSQEVSDEPPELNWGNIGQRMQWEAEHHDFAGSVLVVREGEVIFQDSYGLANREKQHPCTNETIYAVGSTPIDFTKASILLLVDRGRLSLEDPITKFFDDVPDDKQSITIEHLMTGRSGLRDFHDLPGDKNPDHTWIDRAEAIERILDHQLLFEPGSGRQHSHSAWGLLAAIVEIASGQSYQEFTRENIYKPLEMNDTGFFGEEFPEQRVAVGYGMRKSSEPNSPPHWGPTSWLVMGSGGQVSTLGDMLRFVQGMQSGKILSGELTERHYSGGGAYSNGDMFGFEFIYTDGPGNMVFLISNSINSQERRENFDRLGRDLMALAGENDRPPYSLGIAMNVTGEGVVIEQVIPDSAAARDGLKSGDRLISIGGTALGDDPIELLQPYLESGKPIEIEVERDGERRTVTVTPEKR